MDLHELTAKVQCWYSGAALSHFDFFPHDKLFPFLALPSSQHSHHWALPHWHYSSSSSHPTPAVQAATQSQVNHCVRTFGLCAACTCTCLISIPSSLHTSVSSYADSAIPSQHVNATPCFRAQTACWPLTKYLYSRQPLYQCQDLKTSITS